MSAKAASANPTRIAASSIAKPRLTRMPKANITPERARVAVQVTLDVQPLIEIVSRHVTLSRSALARLRKDFLVALGNPPKITTVAEPGEPAPEVLSTEEAAQLVGVSRPYLVKQVELGRIPLHQKVGNQRRLLKRDVLAWQTGERRSQSAAFAKLADEFDAELFGS